MQGEKDAAGPGRGAAAGEDRRDGSADDSLPPVPASGFDDGALDRATSEQVRGIATRIRARATGFYVEIGRDLIAAQEVLGHGRFVNWLAAEFGWTDRTARNFMSAARLVEGNSEIVSVLPATAIYKLAAPSTPEAARDAIIARAIEGEPLTVRHVSSAIREARDAAVKAAHAEAENKRIARLTPSSRRRLQKRKEEQAREAERSRQQNVEGEAAANAAANLLVDRLGDDFAEFMDYLDRANWWRLHEALKARRP